MEVIKLVKSENLNDEIHIQFTTNAQISWFGDKQKIFQVLLNLIMNSIEAILETKIKDGEIIVELDKEENSGVVRIIDNGVGIKPTALDQIFTPFFSTKENGTGLGLAIVKKMITKLKGKIEVNSIPNKKTQFSIYFPIAKTIQKATK